MYFARLNSDNLVVDVVVADQSFVDAAPGAWVQTDPSGISPTNYAGIGYTWRPDLNGFVGPKPDFPSWTLNGSTCLWQAPVAYPSDGQAYRWNETGQSWDPMPY